MVIASTAREGMQAGPSGAILVWHVDDIEGAFVHLVKMDEPAA